MIDVEWCRLMAAYNAEMNRRLYAAAAGLSDDARRQERGAWFGSIHGTLCHLLWADRQWMSRFAGWEKPPPGQGTKPPLIEDFSALRAAREAEDARLEGWAATLTPDWLAGDLIWFSGGSQQEMAQKRWVLLTHLFNHQTHHRGQAHDLITQAGVRPAATDLPWIVDLKSLGIAPG